MNVQRYFDPLAVALDDAFPGQLKIVGVKDAGTTGNFEVFIEATGELIHSKTQRGQGRCETEDERDAVIEKIRAYLATL